MLPDHNQGRGRIVAWVMTDLLLAAPDSCPPTSMPRLSANVPQPPAECELEREKSKNQAMFTLNRCLSFVFSRPLCAAGRCKLLMFLLLDPPWNISDNLNLGAFPHLVRVRVPRVFRMVLRLREFGTLQYFRCLGSYLRLWQLRHNGLYWRFYDIWDVMNFETLQLFEMFWKIFETLTFGV